MEHRSASGELDPDSFGWARFDAGGVKSITIVQQSEDAYAEDRYFVGPNKSVVKMIRTGHYIKDPWVSLTFEPKKSGRLRLDDASKLVIQKMIGSKYETYFADWDHYSRVDQIPFARLIESGNGAPLHQCAEPGPQHS